MADFELAVAKTIKNEGSAKYTETVDDKGGATKYGISLKFLKDATILGHKPHSNATKDTIKNLTLEEALFIYKNCFWDANRYGEIENQVIAEKVFDMAVLMGAPWANKCLQNVFIECGFVNFKADGIIGLHSLDMIHTMWEGYMIYVFKHNLTNHYRSICNKKKTQSKFLLGWLNRVMS